MNAVAVYLEVLKLRGLLQEADLRAKSLASHIPPDELVELIAKLRACQELVERLLARTPGS